MVVHLFKILTSLSEKLMSRKMDKQYGDSNVTCFYKVFFLWSISYLNSLISCYIYFVVLEHYLTESKLVNSFFEKKIKKLMNKWMIIIGNNGDYIIE